MELWKNQFKESVLKKGLELVENHQIVDIYQSETGIDDIVLAEGIKKCRILMMNLIDMF